MIFHKGDKLILDADGTLYTYIVWNEEIDNRGMSKIIATDEFGNFVSLTKSTIEKGIGTTWQYYPLTQPLPDELFTI